MRSLERSAVAREPIALVVRTLGAAAEWLVLGDLATKLGMTVFGHAAVGRYICYVGHDRLTS